MPYVEQDAVASGSIDYELPIVDPTNKEARETIIKLYRCPSDIGDDTFVLEACGLHHHHDSLAPNGHTCDQYVLATANYVGVFGIHDPHEVYEGGRQANGTFIHNRQFGFRDFLDGTTETLIVGERSSKLSYSTWVGSIHDGEHSPARVVGVTRFPPNSDYSAEAAVHNFSSLHPAGTQFVAADGSVRLVNESIEMRVYHALCTRAGGEVVGEH